MPLTRPGQVGFETADDGGDGAGKIGPEHDVERRRRQKRGVLWRKWAGILPVDCGSERDLEVGHDLAEESAQHRRLLVVRARGYGRDFWHSSSMV